MSESGPRVIGMTGGGLGGKSTFLHHLRELDPSGEKYLTLPETADFVFGLGFSPAHRDFELAVYRMQVSLEETLKRLANASQTIVTHRGTLDCLPFWLKRGGSEEEFFEATDTNWADEYARYSLILHFESVAIGLPDLFLSSDRTRPIGSVGPLEDTVEHDLQCAAIWRAHPGYVHLTNEGTDWGGKIKKAMSAMGDLSSQTRCLS